ncbi:hypothetical protein HAHE_04400 [Haloferula helveola]|uniref:Uncharacterized protein n=1 Tax=Haloferula helveola TaxID=490095 RepID=A0ABM7RFN5_9BACT|nr:hypothetical protein HAHE_04400 [Haloferula helveola]
MKNFLSTLRMAALAGGALLFIGASDSLNAQGKVSVGKLEFDNLPSPDLQGTKNKSFKPKDWLEVEVGITIPAQNKTMLDSGFVDRVLVKWYVAIKEKASGRPMLLTKDINHINVPIDEEFFSSVYLSPNTLKRLTGSDRAGKSAVEAIAVEVLLNGVKVAEESEKMKSGWWNSPSLARGDRFPLLNKSETPFKMYWWDRYAEIEEER